MARAVDVSMFHVEQCCLELIREGKLDLDTAAELTVLLYNSECRCVECRSRREAEAKEDIEDELPF